MLDPKSHKMMLRRWMMKDFRILEVRLRGEQLSWRCLSIMRMKKSLRGQGRRKSSFWMCSGISKIVQTFHRYGLKLKAQEDLGYFEF